MLKVSVSSLLRYVKNSMKADERLNRIYVAGEISNYHLQNSSGHIYFSLKDEYAVLNCVMFRSDAQSLRFSPKVGDKVVAYGSVSVFENAGQLQLYVSRLSLDGLGELYARYEALKQKLDEEGKFAADHKTRMAKTYPDRIAVLTGDDSAALSDIRTAFARRWPLCRVDVYPVLVQGLGAPEDICSRLIETDELGYDAIILARGGGSFEDLFCFNDERLVNVIYGMKTFLVTGIGHEQDFTLADFVADLRAPTPTAAVELITPDIIKVGQLLDDLQQQMKDDIYHKIDRKRMSYDFYLQRLLNYRDHLHSISQGIDRDISAIRMSIVNAVARKKDAVDHYQAGMRARVDLRLNEARLTYKRLNTLLEAYSAQNVLKRGYTLVFQDQKLIKRKSQLHDSPFEIRFADGSIMAQERKDDE